MNTQSKIDIFNTPVFTPMKDKESLIKKFQLLQKTKNELLQKVDNLSETQLNEITTQGKWSIAQVMYHVYLAELMSLQYMKKKTSELTQLQKAGIREALKSLLLQVSLKLPIKYKAPKALAEKLPEHIDWNEFLLKWGDTRDETYKFINWLPAEALNKGVFRHPTTGLMRIDQTLDFFQAHFEHHVPQITSQLELLRNPSK